MEKKKYYQVVMSYNFKIVILFLYTIIMHIPFFLYNLLLYMLYHNKSWLKTEFKMSMQLSELIVPNPNNLHRPASLEDQVISLSDPPSTWIKCKNVAGYIFLFSGPLAGSISDDF